MKNIILITISLLFFKCNSPKPEPKYPIFFKPISNESLAIGVIYEANIRQYSNEGTFNAFAKDLTKNKGVRCKYNLAYANLSDLYDKK